MIPKNINLIWLGDTIPDYVFYSKTAYQKMNQDFNVQLIHYTNNQIEYFIQCDNITSTMSNIDIALWNSIHDFLNNPEDMLSLPIHKLSSIFLIFDICCPPYSFI